MEFRGALAKPQLDTQLSNVTLRMKKKKKNGMSGERKRQRRVAAGAAVVGAGCWVNLHRGERIVMNHVISGLAADELLKNSEFISIFVCNF